jgi:hypothetical protein
VFSSSSFTDTSLLLKNAIALHNQYKYEEAVKAYENIIKKSPKSLDGETALKQIRLIFKKRPDLNPKSTLEDYCLDVKGIPSEIDKTTNSRNKKAYSSQNNDLSSKDAKGCLLLIGFVIGLVLLFTVPPLGALHLLAIGLFVGCGRTIKDTKWD